MEYFDLVSVPKQIQVMVSEVVYKWKEEIPKEMSVVWSRLCIFLR